jgi:hypothetical protein
MIWFIGRADPDLTQILSNQEHIMAQLADVLAAVTAVDASVDALAARIPAPSTPEDLQPAVDALTAVKAKLDALVPAAPAA